ncbi:Uncharacterised protein [Vibrio mimicus]|uniref:EpsG family protein n=1 Tax=Vibrio mimicus TaxID=674 RepID=UPI0002BAB1B4|nr:EpsG family protein [Vibrio mimicus]EMB49850.1 hypothetical protein D908_11248 [Vibrio mimicus CAIM 602]MBY7675983.1 EpsG family protein [Vibrio mimicus]MBY7727843.1 EpsG family protein [Vibrio mimicus]TXY28792.1 EpsG family protein [Vibrio mimicus]SUP15719.1 Uncharacterised protein [Vibrio mimicus]
MAYYYFLLIISFGFLFSKINYLIGKYIYIFLIAFLFVISAFRVGVKPDYYNYEYFYNLISSGYDFYQYGLYGVEYSFLIISSLFSEFESGFRYTLILYSLLTMLFIGLAYPKLTKEPILAVAIYYSFFFIVRDMGVIRAGLAYAILIYALVFYSERKILLFSIFVLFASVFHQSAMVFFVLMIFYFHNPNSDKLFYILVFSVIFYIFGMSHLIIEVLSSGGGYVSGKFQDYGKESELNYVLGFLDINNIKNFLLSLVGIHLFRKKIVSGNLFNVLLMVFIVGTCVRIVFLDFSSIAGRLSSIFMSVEPLYISMLVGSINNIRYKIIAYIMLFLYCFGMLYLGIEKYETLEYQTVIEEIY